MNIRLFVIMSGEAYDNGPMNIASFCDANGFDDRVSDALRCLQSGQCVDIIDDEYGNGSERTLRCLRSDEQIVHGSIVTGYRVAATFTTSEYPQDE